MANCSSQPNMMTDFTLFTEPLDASQLESWALPSPIDGFTSTPLFPNQFDMSDLGWNMERISAPEPLATPTQDCSSIPVFSDHHLLLNSPIIDLGSSPTTAPSSSIPASPSSWSSFSSPSNDPMDSSCSSDAEDCINVRMPSSTPSSPSYSSTSERSQNRNRNRKPRQQATTTRRTNKKPISHDAPASPISKDSKRVKAALAHSIVESRYRNSLNASIEKLRLAVPHLAQLGSSSTPYSADSLPSISKPSKGTILASAVEYIKNIEGERDRLREENAFLRGMVACPVSTLY